MTIPPSTTGEQLAGALEALGVRFIMGGGSQDRTSMHRQPARLIAALAGSDEARLRLALIPLFLTHPEFSAHARTAAKELAPSARLTLQCYYNAALWLGKMHGLTPNPLPDHFSGELGLHPTGDPEENLRTLAKRHQELSGAHINWLGTYHHAARKWAVQKQAEWKRTGSTSS